jgi:multidrug efflux system membrane fusion protein
LKKSAWIAIGLVAGTAAWIGSGYVFREDEEQPAPAEPQSTLVQVRPSRAQTVPQYIFAQGSAQPFRTASVTAQVGGTINEVLVERGDVMDAGAVVARISLDERGSSRESAEATVEAIEAELEGIRKLEDDGFATASRVRELEASLEEARAALAAVREDIEDTTVVTAIPGVVGDVYVNAGQAAAAGTLIADVIDNSPLRVSLQLSQIDVGRIQEGTIALVSFATGEAAKGRVCFIAPAADPSTRTFLVEVRVANDDGRIPSRISAELRLDAGEAKAHFVSPAILSLDDKGRLGVKSVGEENRVDFYPVETLRSERDGVWIAGLPDELRLITIGQGFVRQDEVVRIAEADQRENRGGQAAQAAGIQGGGDENLPTASIQSEGIESKDDLPEPPPAERICALRGADAAGRGGTAGAGAGAGTSGTEGVQGTSGTSPFAEPTNGAGGSAVAPPQQPGAPAVTPPTVSAPAPAPANPPAANPAPAAPPAGTASPAPGGASGGSGPGGASGGAQPGGAQ